MTIIFITILNILTLMMIFHLKMSYILMIIILLLVLMTGWQLFPGILLGIYIKHQATKEFR